MQNITDEMIVEEYLNNWFTYDELAQYLVVPIDRINDLFNIQSLISVVGFKKASKALKHANNILNYYSDSPRQAVIVDEKTARIVTIARYIVSNSSSVRATASHFDISKSTVFEYMTEQLPAIDISLYKQVFDVLMDNKTIGVLSQEMRKQVLDCYTLLENGLTSQEIQKVLGISRNVLQRNLDTRLKKIDEVKYKRAKEILAAYKKESQGHIDYIKRGNK